MGLHNEKQVVANIVSIIEQIKSKNGVVPGKFKNVRALYLKTHDSVALPIYNASYGTTDTDEIAGIGVEGKQIKSSDEMTDKKKSVSEKSTKKRKIKDETPERKKKKIPI